MLERDKISSTVQHSSRQINWDVAGKQAMKNKNDKILNNTTKQTGGNQTGKDWFHRISQQISTKIYGQWKMKIVYTHRCK